MVANPLEYAPWWDCDLADTTRNQTCWGILFTPITKFKISERMENYSILGRCIGRDGKVLERRTCLLT